MAKNPASLPKYRKQKRPDCADQAFVVLDGRRHYLGAHGTPESREAFRRIIARWLVAGSAQTQPRTNANPDGVTVNEIIAAFWQEAQKHYRRPDGSHTSELENYRCAFRILRHLYGSTPAAAFGPLDLMACRREMIERSWARTSINRQVGRIRRLFKWAVSREMGPPSVIEALRTVEGLRRGRSDARETEAVKPVPETDIEAIRPLVSRQVWCIIDLQLLTAARGGELVGLRPMDLDRSELVWTFTPDAHKTAHHNHERVIYFGPRSQAIITPFMNRAPHKPLFSPIEAERERAAQAPTHRRTDQKPTSRKTQRTIREAYTTGSYRRAIERACQKAGVKPWRPHQLRHNSGTWIRAEFGVEMAMVILGHKSVGITEIYAEQDKAKAKQAIAKIG